MRHHKPKTMKKYFLVFIAAYMLLLSIITPLVMSQGQQNFDDIQFAFLYFTEFCALLLFALSGFALYNHNKQA